MTASRRTHRRLSGSALWLVLVLYMGVIGLVSVTSSTRDASAVNGNLRQQILPLDCIYETVNDGTGTIIYLTPEECGQIPDPGPDPDPDPDPVTPVDPIPGVVTVVDNGVRVRVFRVNTIPTTTVTEPAAPTPTNPTGPVINARQATPNTNEIIISWKVPAGSSFKEFSIEARLLGTTTWKPIATAADNRRSTVITLEAGEYEVRVLGIPINPADEPTVLGVTRVVVEYAPLPQTKAEPDYSWIWILVSLVAVTMLWWFVSGRQKRRS